MNAAAQLAPRERYHPRVEANLMIKLLMDGRAIMAKAKDLSMAGLALVGRANLGRERITIAIPLPGDREIVTACRVRRTEDDAVALEFEHLDWDDMFALARFLHPRLP